MLAAGVKSPVPLEELEIHLHEEIERQINLGGREAEAFSLAVQIVGSAQTVQCEFKKLEETEPERKWTEGQIWSGAVLGLLQLVVLGAVLFNPYMTFGQRMSGLAAMATSILLVGAVGLNHRFFPVILNRRTRTAVSFMAGVVPACLCILILGYLFLMGHEFPFGHYLAGLLWASCPPLAVSLGVIFGFEAAARRGIIPITD